MSSGAKPLHHERTQRNDSEIQRLRVDDKTIRDEARDGNDMRIALESMAVAMPEVEGHPNRVEFRGVLTLVDVASQRAPSGSGGQASRADAEGRRRRHCRRLSAWRWIMRRRLTGMMCGERLG